MSVRTLRLFLLLILFFSGTILSYAASPVTPPSLDCKDFKVVMDFIQEQHLRFQFGKPGEGDFSYMAAEAQIPQTLLALGYPMLAGTYQERISTEIKKANFNSINDICQKLEQTIYRAAFLKSYARNLDPYSDFYLTEELDSKSSALSGEFVGVGIATEPLKDALQVTEVLPDGPAYGKMFAGDLIQTIDGHSVTGLNEAEIRQRIRGAIKTKVNFTGQRGKNHFNVTIVRDRIIQRSVSFNWMADRVLVVKIQRFFRQTADEVEAIVTKEAPKAKGIILDLRDNPGGLLQGARDVVDLFISQGVVVYLKGKSFEDQVWALHEGGILNKPIVILVNEGTASAAEIVAGALQDYGRAVLVGEKTYGKGSVQNIYETQPALGTRYKGGLKLTTLWYYLPSGRSVASLEPDVKISTPNSETSRLSHPMMPYSGPKKIDVLPLPSFAYARNNLNLQKMNSIVKGVTDSEQAGRALLLQMSSDRPTNKTSSASEAH